MTGEELYILHTKHGATMWPGAWSWENQTDDNKAYYNAIAADIPNVPVSIIDVHEAVIALSQSEKRQLYKFLHDACGCRM